MFAGFLRTWHFIILFICVLSDLNVAFVFLKRYGLSYAKARYSNNMSVYFVGIKEDSVPLFL